MLSSDLKRAQETSQIISDKLNLNPIFNSGFREVFLGDGQGKLINEVDSYFGKLLGRSGMIIIPSMTHFDFQMESQNKRRISEYIFP
ncbi:histidine phosphatase superfamily (branch 1) domain protein [Leptospira kirschneri str. 200801925]|nr:histidine phosphatase superfamily (branch 1) domain protein [Leptospira kirschneri str. 200801925]